MWNQLKLTRELYNAGLEELIVHHKATGKHLKLLAQDKNHGTKEHPDDSGSASGYHTQEASPIVLEFLWSLQRRGYQERIPTFQSAQSLAFTAVSRCKNQRDWRAYFCAPRAMGGRMRFNRHRDIQGIIKFCRVLRKPSGWILQVVCERQPELLPKTEQEYWVGFWYQRFGLGQCGRQSWKSHSSEALAWQIASGPAQDFTTDQRKSKTQEGVSDCGAYSRKDFKPTARLSAQRGKAATKTGRLFSGFPRTCLS